MVELFKIGFLPVTLLDILDIFLVSFIFYKLYSVIKGTIAAQIFYGLIIVLILSFVAQGLNLKALSWILKLITDIWVIAFIILFQPEIRRLLVLVGRNRIINLVFKKEEKNVPEIITEAAFDLAQVQHGALMVITLSTGLKAVIESGEMIQSKISKNLLRSIFFPRSPLHDGAVIISNGIIEAARCTLPLTQKTNIGGIDLGMRHRAAVGITEQADVICIVVSEETGSISIAQDGNISRGVSKEFLYNRLSDVLNISKDKGWKSIFENFSK